MVADDSAFKGAPRAMASARSITESFCPARICAKGRDCLALL
jgi:hypothetical protein